MNKLAMFLAAFFLTLFVTACADAGQPASLNRDALPADVQRFSESAALGDLDALKAQLPAEYAGLVDEYAAQLDALKAQLPDDYAELVDAYAADLGSLKSQLPADFAALVDEYAAGLEDIKAQLPPEYAALVEAYVGDLDALPVSEGPRALTKLPRPKQPGNVATAGNASAPRVLQNFPAVTMPKSVTDFPNIPDHKAFTNPPTASGPRALAGGKRGANIPVGAKPGAMPAQSSVKKPEVTRPQRPEKPNVSPSAQKGEKRRNWPQVTNPPFPQKPPTKFSPVPYSGEKKDRLSAAKSRFSELSNRFRFGFQPKPMKDIPRTGF